jgi:NhaP-type Na+/H+ or K+/H+ antiporter
MPSRTQRLKRALKEPTTLVGAATALYYAYHLASHGNNDRTSILVLACAIVLIAFFCKDRTSH